MGGFSQAPQVGQQPVLPQHQPQREPPLLPDLSQMLSSSAPTTVGSVLPHAVTVPLSSSWLSLPQVLKGGQSWSASRTQHGAVTLAIGTLPDARTSQSFQLFADLVGGEKGGEQE